MDAGDDRRKGYRASIIIESHSTANEDRLTPEDIAWADSCLVKDIEVLESNWNSFKDALLEVLDNHPESLPSVITSDSSLGGSDVIMPPSTEVAEAVRYLARTGDNIFVDPINEEAKINVDGISTENNRDILSQVLQEDVVETFQGNPFLPTYNEDQRVGKAVDSGHESLSVNDVDPSTNGDIFRVWDLNIPTHEEFDLVKQLKKALQEAEDQKIEPNFDGVEYQSTKPTSDDSVAWKAVEEKSIDQIVTGIADLSLNQDSS